MVQRSNQSLVYLSVELSPGKFTDVPDAFDKRTGGNADSSETKYRSGGMQPEVSIGGTQTVENVTVSRGWNIARDLDLARRIAARRGIGEIRCTEIPLDAEGTPLAVDPLKWAGKIKSVNWPDSDASADSAAMFDVVISTHGKVG